MSNSKQHILRVLGGASVLLTARQVANALWLSERQTLNMLTELLDEGKVQRTASSIGTGGSVGLWRLRTDPFQELAAAFGGYTYMKTNVKETR